MQREWSSWRALRKLNSLPMTQRATTFYSHGRQDWPHLWPLAVALAKNEDVRLAYVCATVDDPALSTAHPGIECYLLDGDIVRSVFFRTIAGQLLVTTLPDLGSGPWKRSAQMKRYVFIPHSMVSCHMIYRPGAFAAFDEIFCAGPHHVEELRALELVLKSPRKTLFEYGYPRIDALMQETTNTDRSGEGLRVLVAPSWGPDGLFETIGIETVTTLLSKGCNVVARPHPETLKRSPQCLRAIGDRFAGDPHFSFDHEIEAYGSLKKADVLVSDWSGVALEFAFGLERPVVFIDTPRKVNNADYGRIDIEPLEVTIRAELGAILPKSRLDALPALALRLARKDREPFVARMRNLRKRYAYNLGNATTVGARRLRNLIDMPRHVHGNE